MGSGEYCDMYCKENKEKNKEQPMKEKYGNQMYGGSSDYASTGLLIVVPA